MKPGKQKIASKIRKLLSLSNSGNEHEAEQAARKASTLMTEHQLSFREVDLEDQGNDEIVEKIYEPHTINRRWVPTLAMACARIFDSMVVVHPKNRFCFVGFEQDNAAAEELFRHLYHSWQGIVRRDTAVEECQRFSAGSPAPVVTTYRNSHGVGFSRMINKRATKLVAERRETVAAVSSIGTALVEVKGQALKEYEENQNWTKRDGRRSNNWDQTGLNAGKNAGAAIPLGGAVKNNKTLQIELS